MWVDPTARLVITASGVRVSVIADWETLRILVCWGLILLIKVSWSWLLLLNIGCIGHLMWLPVIEVPVMSVVDVTIVVFTICVIVAVVVVVVVDLFVVVVVVVVVAVVSASAALPVVTVVTILSSLVIIVGVSAAQIFVPRRTVVCEIELVSVQVISIVSIFRGWLNLSLIFWLLCVEIVTVFCWVMKTVTTVYLASVFTVALSFWMFRKTIRALVQLSHCLLSVVQPFT